MRSKLGGFSGDGVRRLARIGVERPWLCGAAALAVVIAGLFAWFCGQRWDQVDVSTPPEAQRQPVLTRLRSGAPLRAESENLNRNNEAASGAEHVSEFKSTGARVPIAFRSAARPVAVDTAAPAETMPSAADRARGAWLVGTIEEIEDGFRDVRGGGAWPGLASHPGAQRR